MLSPARQTCLIVTEVLARLGTTHQRNYGEAKQKQNNLPAKPRNLSVLGAHLGIYIFLAITQSLTRLNNIQPAVENLGSGIEG